jgi:hypothetical protein
MAPRIRAVGADLATPAFVVCCAGAEGWVPLGATDAVLFPAGYGASTAGMVATGPIGEDWRVVGAGLIGAGLSGVGADCGADCGAGGASAGGA